MFCLILNYIFIFLACYIYDEEPALEKIGGQPVNFQILTDVSSARACQDLCKINDNCRYFLYGNEQQKECKLRTRRGTFGGRPGGYNEGWDPDATSDLQIASGMIFGPKLCATGKIKSRI